MLAFGKAEEGEMYRQLSGASRLRGDGLSIPDIALGMIRQQPRLLAGFHAAELFCYISSTSRMWRSSSLLRAPDGTARIA
jgi:hypothetical protein